MRKVFPKIRYASIGELSIAYQVWGEADNVLVYVPGIVSHLEVTLEIKGYVKWIENLSKNFKVIIFDKCIDGFFAYRKFNVFIGA